MHSNASPPTVAAWGPQHAPTDAPDAPVWVRGRVASSRRSPRRRWGLILVAALLALGCLSLVQVLRWYHAPQPVTLVLVGAGYETNLALPENVAGWRSLNQMTELTREHYSVPEAGPIRLRTADRWDRDLEKIDSPIVLIYLALHGACDETGPFLYRDDVDGRGLAEMRLRFADLLQRLRRLPAERTKILVLDATHREEYPSLGIVRNEFVRGVLQLNDEIRALPNLVVLLSSGPDQRSWVSPEFGESVFGRFFRNALSGNIPDPNADGWLQLEEVFDHVREQVNSWAAANRNAAQTPLLLPLGDEGRRRARWISLCQPRSQPTPSVELSQERSDELREVWNRVQQLRSRKNPPWIVAPHLWTRYLSTILRYEALLDAGDTANASLLRVMIREQEEAMLRWQTLDLESLTLSLQLPALAGYPSEPTPLLRQLVRAVWDRSYNDAAKLLGQLNASVDGDVRRMTVLRLQAMLLLVLQAAEAPDVTLEHLLEMLRQLDDPSRISPVEVQFLQMLHQYGPIDELPRDLIVFATAVRLLAERAALGVALEQEGIAYSETVAMFVRSWIVAADQERLVAQDLLFSHAPEDWAKARTGLAKARELYLQALQRANRIREIYRTRARILSELPWYGSWLSRLERPDAPAEQQRLERDCRRYEELWEKLHRIQAALPTIQQMQDPRYDITLLERLTQECSEAHQQLVRSYQERIAELNTVNLPSVWHEADAALAMPLLDPETRLRLRNTRRQISWRFYTESLQAGNDLLSEATMRQRSDWTGNRVGRILLATLGKSEVDHPRPQVELESYDRLAYRLNTFPAESEGWRSLLAVSVSLAQLWPTLAEQINVACETGLRSQEEAGYRELQRAEALAHIIDAAATGRMSYHPTDILRRDRVGRLMVLQAQRTWQEHWQSLSANDVPYYRRAGRLYLTDSGTFLPEAELTAIRQRLDAPGLFELHTTAVRPPSSASIPITSEFTYALPLRVHVPDAQPLPTGYLTWEIVPMPGLEQVTGKPLRRWSLPFDGRATQWEVELRNRLLREAEQRPPETAEPIRGEIVARALFRGQLLEQRLPIAVHRIADTTVNTFPPPRLASVAVRATDEVVRRYGASNGTVAIVLDCSGSMGAPPGQEFSQDTKYAHATQAVEHLLKQLPAGTQVSLRVFGQAVGDRGAVAEPEKEIRTILPLTRWNPADTARLDAVMKLIRYPALVPWNQSPILRAMAEAKRDFVGSTGFRTLVVITDGADNRYQNDAWLNPAKKTFPALVRELFDQSGIAVHVIGFRIDPDEEQEAREQFAALPKFDPPGSFVTESNLEGLIQSLRNALRQELRFWVATSGHVLVDGIRREGLPVGHFGGGDRWLMTGVAPGGYHLRVISDRRLDREIQLATGDRLLLQLRQRNGQLALERASWSASDFPQRPYREQHGWRVALLQNQRSDRAFQGLVTLERLFDPLEVISQSFRPKSVWFEWQAVETPAVPLARRWSPVFGYPAPAWSLDCAAWPTVPDRGGPARPLVQVWWNPDQEPRLASRLDPQRDYRTVTEIKNRSLFVDGEEVFVRSVTVEDHVVDLPDGRRETRSCLVVRVAHGVTNPVLVRITGLPLEGESLWQYRSVGQTTAVFWPVRPEQVDRVASVELISLRAFRREAEQRGFAVTLDPLPAPDTSDTRPRPPVPLP